MKNPTKPFKNKNGSVLIQVIVSFAIIMIVVLALMEMLRRYQLEQQRASLQTTLGNLQNDFQKAIANSQGWMNTVYDVGNTSMVCLRDITPPTACTNIAASYNLALPRFILRDGANNVFYNGTAANTNGFTLQGQPCTGFSYNTATGGNTNCPIGFILTWRALSSDIKPQVVVTAKLIFNPANDHPFKAFFNKLETSTIISNYDTEVYK